MVTISKPTKRSRTTLVIKKTAVFIFLIVLLWIGFQWLLWFGGSGGSRGGSRRNSSVQSLRTQNKQKQQQPLPKIKGVPQPKNIQQSSSSSSVLLLQQSKSIVTKLDVLSKLAPLSTNNDSSESKFLSIIRKECLPGRDDHSGEINPTTHQKRECLRHVPLGKKLIDFTLTPQEELETRMKRQKPRIGLMIPPGFVSGAFAHWVADVLQQTSKKLHMEIDIVITSHVPVYGYGKSHGYTKLIRFISLPISLAAYDAYLMGSSTTRELRDTSSSTLQDVLEGTKLGRNVEPPSVVALGKMVQLVMRWHCRLSHVSAHTAMLTLSLEDALKDPTDVLSNILSFVWREDWEWEGHGGNHPAQDRDQPHGSWKEDAKQLVENDHGDLLQRLVEQTSIILGETTPLAQSDNGNNDNNAAFQKAMQGAFASEMNRSSDMTSWPCPSFWEGVVQNDTNSNDDILMNVMQKLAREMVPNCSDEDPYARCTVNRDRCEVRGDAKC